MGGSLKLLRTASPPCTTPCVVGLCYVHVYIDSAVWCVVCGNDHPYLFCQLEKAGSKRYEAECAVRERANSQ